MNELEKQIKMAQDYFYSRYGRYFTPDELADHIRRETGWEARIDMVMTRSTMDAPNLKALLNQGALTCTSAEFEPSGGENGRYDEYRVVFEIKGLPATAGIQLAPPAHARGDRPVVVRYEGDNDVPLDVIASTLELQIVKYYRELTKSCKKTTPPTQSG